MKKKSVDATEAKSELFGWVGGAAALVFAGLLIFGGEVPYFAFSLLIASALLLPVARKLAYSRTGFRLHIALRSASVVAVMFSGIVLQQAVNNREKAQYFEANSGSIIKDARDALNDGDYSHAKALSAKYAIIKNNDLEAIYSESKAYLDAAERAENEANAESERLANLAAEKKKQNERVGEIIAELKTIPSSEYTKNWGLYLELTKLLPDNAKYQNKLSYYRVKMDEEDSRNLAIAQEQERERNALIAKFGVKPLKFGRSYSPVKRYLKYSANDPDSIDIQGCNDVSYNEQGWLVACTYRGKNAFGALIRDSNWFTILNGVVVNVQSIDKYKLN